MKTAAIIWGVIFLIIGFLGMVPGVAPNGMLFGIFRVDGLHNAVHLLTGLIAVLVAFSGSDHAARVYFETVGIIYALLMLLGFYYGDTRLLGLIAHNRADAWLHGVISVVALYLGFVWGKIPLQLRSTPTGRM